MQKIASLPILLIALIPVISMAQAGDSPLTKDGKPVIRPNIVSKEGFGAQIWLTEHSKFFDNFAKGGNMRFEATSHVRRNIPVFLAIFITGPGIDASGSADVTCDITIRKPDGTVYFEAKDVPCWSGKYTYTPDSTEVADAKVKLKIESNDPKGKYAIEAVVHDKIKGVNLTPRMTFDVAH